MLCSNLDHPQDTRWSRWDMLRVRHGWDQGKLRCSVTPLGPIGGHPKSCESAEKPHITHSSKVHFGEEKKKEGKVCSNFPPARAESSTSHRLLARHHRPSHSSTPHGWGGDPRTFLSSSGCPPAGASITIPQVQSKIRSPVPTQGYGYG